MFSKKARFVSGWTTASIEGAGRAEGSHHAARAAASHVTGVL